MFKLPSKLVNIINTTKVPVFGNHACMTFLQQLLGASAAYAKLTYSVN